ncbi:MAG: Lrp/AsnC family transcriptional regulator [Thaumarchaeota archaeon]|jgi:Lrp/AsnC family transcriptional regulator for asnA, asnC and gidA|nr:Lrp/AsnC family transcriptional regulator [Candidatus Geocrenenecus arthurdayi]MCL7391179.1 Lrp/AsnC family transcriptional regulator [Candidatus Geocrenenecus arthurdayi]MCL7396800.1 Lrp/AsnC family transcriptional regulator [Candidatus Geocrenenecus arthurdayi]MCL7402806.1 Lrp/AsnC family transcriptional regulator [Candidatus Geocrenenecus arthurdayi]
MKSLRDEKDLEILRILQENGRASYSEIAKKLGLSEAAVYTRIQKLMKHGFIKKIQAVIDSEKLGFNLTAIVAVKAQPSKYEYLLKQLSEIPEIVEIYDVTGDYYCLLKLRLQNREALAKLLDRIGAMDGVISTDTRIVLRTIKESYSLPL